MPWAHFTEAELRCKCRDAACPRLAMQEAFMEHLEALRVAFGQPMPICSGFRCPSHNHRVSKTGLTGPHTTGRAVDVRIALEPAYELLQLALEQGFTGVGINQKGPEAGRFIHLDDLTLADGFIHPRPRVWSY